MYASGRWPSLGSSCSSVLFLTRVREPFPRIALAPLILFLCPFSHAAKEYLFACP